jgi:hypothetical protein
MRWFTDSGLRQIGLCFIIIIFLSGTALAQTVKGRVVRQAQNRLLPAIYVPVALVRPGWEKTVYTDPEGWYYFYHVAPGSYTVAIQNMKNGPRVSVRVKASADVDVPRFVIP